MANELYRDVNDIALDAILYALNDPALDREAFELRLAEDADLCESVADAVAWIEAARSDMLLAQRVDAHPHTTVRELRAWYWIAGLAACVSLIASLNWIQGSRSDRDRVVMGNMLDAWTALQRDGLDLSAGNEDIRLSRVELGIPNDPSWDDDDTDTALPEWLITATAASEPNSTVEAIQ